MRSIRLSLIVYFLTLTTAVLGAVSYFVYHTTAQTLEDRKADSINLINAQYRDRCEEVQQALDQRILRQAQTVAKMARTVMVQYEVQYPLSLIGTPGLPNSHLSLMVNAGPMAYAFHEEFSQRGLENEETGKPRANPKKGNPRGLNPQERARSIYYYLANTLFRPRPAIDIESAEDLIPFDDENHPEEYFQVYRHSGQPLRWSEPEEEPWFALDPEVIETAEPLQEYFDTVEVEPGLKLRRVTLRASVTRYHSGAFSWPGMMPLPGGRGAGFWPGPPPGRRTMGAEREAPVIFIQYASDMAPQEAKMLEFAAYRDQQLAQLETEIANNLHSLAAQLFWIFFATLAAVVVGGFVLVRLGLMPLARLSDAVSRVSEKDFRLKVDGRKLPLELQPIAERLTQTLEQLHQAFDREKQAAADISHELRTPLAALLTTVEVALKKSRSVEEYQEILEDCRYSGQQMSLLVERLLTLARLDAGADRFRPREADLSDVALQCAGLVRPLARARGIELRCQVEPGLIAQTDPDKIREVLTNLLHNAIEYNRPAGAIDLQVKRVGKELVLEVRDTGIGITPDALPRLFERFYRADPSRHADTPHAGLGLAIVKSYVDLMGGTIHVQSSPAGTTFRVRLPFKDERIQVLEPALN